MDDHDSVTIMVTGRGSGECISITKLIRKFNFDVKRGDLLRATVHGKNKVVIEKLKTSVEKD